MKDRFVGGDDARRRLVAALESQRIVNGNSDCANELADVIEVFDLNNGGLLIEQGATDNTICLVLSGAVDVLVFGRKIAERAAGLDVGAMAMIDVSAKRSATVIANTDSVIGKITEEQFAKIANKYPHVWRQIGIDLAARLRERNKLVRPVNEHPLLFIGSSAEAIPYAREVQDALAHDKVIAQIWTDKVFGASKFPLEDLEAAFEAADYALMMIGPDDKVRSRKKESKAPRDNVIFELGMAMGAFTRHRSFMMKPRGIDLKIPSDLIGLGVIEYENAAADDPNLASKMGPACNQLRRTLRDLGPR
jgi:predicted nucleotide-binding protein